MTQGELIQAVLSRLPDNLRSRIELVRYDWRGGEYIVTLVPDAIDDLRDPRFPDAGLWASLKQIVGDEFGRALVGMEK